MKIYLALTRYQEHIASLPLITYTGVGGGGGGGIPIQLLPLCLAQYERINISLYTILARERKHVISDREPHHYLGILGILQRLSTETPTVGQPKNGDI